MKYLHYYENYKEFNSDYLDDAGPSGFTCSGGTFTYDRYDENYMDNGPAYIWLNGDKVLLTPSREAKVGAFDYDEGTGAYDGVNDNPVEILTVGENEQGKYGSPWTSFCENGLPTKFTAHINGTISGTTYNGDYEFIVGDIDSFWY